MYSYRITKYNPINRNELGHYQIDEWISIHDTGKIFDGQKFTYTEYLKVESSYIESIIIFMNFLKISTLDVVSIEKNAVFPDENTPNSKSMLEVYLKITNNSRIDIEQIKDVARLVLREILWCKLENKDMFVHFGWDYYMFLGSSKKLPTRLKRKIEKMGLFVEDFESPHLFDDE